MIRIVLDTNILFGGLSYESYYFPIIRGIYENQFVMLVSTPILCEYEEILRKEYSSLTIEYFLDFLDTSENVVFVNPTFRFQLPFEDEDDQKFVDCAVCGRADFLVTNDKHFRSLQDIVFPKLTIVTAEVFINKFLKAG